MSSRVSSIVDAQLPKKNGEGILLPGKSRTTSEVPMMSRDARRRSEQQETSSRYQRQEEEQYDDIDDYQEDDDDEYGSTQQQYSEEEDDDNLDNISADERTKLTRSKIPWKDPANLKREGNPQRRRPEKDRDDEIAVRADFFRKNPSADVFRRRAKYRPHLWYNGLRLDQRFIVVTTYGPSAKLYDVSAKHVGIEFWGAFETIPEANRHIHYLRKNNPHCVFIPFHILDVYNAKRFQLPLKNDGNINDSELNKDHAEIITTYLANEVRKSDDVEKKMTMTLQDVQRKNDLTYQFNEKLKKETQLLLTLDEKQIKLKRLEARKKVAATLEKIVPEKESSDEEENESTSDDDEEDRRAFSLAEQISTAPESNNDIKSLTFDQVEDYIKNQERIIASNLSPNYRIVHRTYTDTETGREFLVQSVQVFE